MELEELRQAIERHRDLYYNQEAEISDAEYDALEERLREINPDDPLLLGVGAGSSGIFPSAEHRSPMLSLDKVHDSESLEIFLRRFPEASWITWPKFDGVSLSLLYRDGSLLRAATRGDGRVGEDVTENARRSIPDLPQSLPGGWSGEIRGEVMFLRSAWEEYNRQNPDKILANPRNAASGTLRTIHEDDGRRLVFYPYDVLDDPDPAQTLQDLGFKIEGYLEAGNLEEIAQRISDLEERRDDLDYEIDGIVVRVRELDIYKKAGFTSHHPRAAIAYKFRSERGTSVLRDIIWQVGKSGWVAPVGEIDTVVLAGASIRRVTLHNQVVIEDMDLRLGDKIVVERAGDVIPAVVGIDQTRKRTGAEKRPSVPQKCPSCGESLLEEGPSRRLLCSNRLGCPSQKQRRLEHWASRAAADIDSLGPRWIERMLAEDLISEPSDLYRLAAVDLLEKFSGEGMKERLAEKIYQSIKRSRELGMRRALIGWAIPLVSEGTAKRVCWAGYDSIEALSAASEDDLLLVEDIGPEVARSLHNFLALDSTREEIARLRSLGVNLDRLPQDAPQTGVFQDKRFAITGSFDRKRDELKAEIESLGGSVSGSISSKIDYLLAGKGGGQKRTQAEDLGIEIISIEDYQRMQEQKA